MNVVQLLSSKGVSMQQASDWVQANLGQPINIYNVCLEFGINSAMLAEIVQPFVPGVSAFDVEAFFSTQGFNALALRNAGPLPPTPMPQPVPVPQPGPGEGGFGSFFPQEFAGLFSFITLNDNTGALSNASLREASMAQSGQGSAYWTLFNAASIGGSDDGVWTAAELGFGGLGNLPATAETLESLFYGSIIRVVRSIDQQEVNQLEAFVTANESALELGNPTAVNSLISQLSQAFSTPAAVPLVSDQELAAFLPFVTSTAIQLVGTGNPDLFGGLLDFVV